MVKQFTELSSDSKPEEYIKFLDNDDRYKHHTKYFHYTSISALKSILKTKSIWLSRLDNCNDTIEGDYYKNHEDNLFSVCFSTGTKESLPLWYLYAGVDGKGARIEVPRSRITEFVEKGNVYLKNITDGDVGNGILLNRDNDYKIKARDILYGANDGTNGYYRFIYGEKNKFKISKRTYDKVFAKYRPFFKGLIWSYERETRIQVEVNKKLLKSGKEYKVVWDISDILPQIKIMLAPEYDQKSKTELLKDEDIQGYLREQLREQLLMSEYNGTIKMGLTERLCRDCNKDKGGTQK